VGGLTATARHARAHLTIAGVRYDAPVTFCEPWPFAFNLLGQEGFLRFFRVTICAAEAWLEIDPEKANWARIASAGPPEAGGRRLRARSDRRHLRDRARLALDVDAWAGRLGDPSSALV
jgi:hypothetical protein